ncbi:hypothetical protein [Inquilinus limosus]|uniref:hypothetical protein n=1 Tax=Inquilinus limosus TaxID=171674 RepID=UPI00040B277A|nr:hypothetical protein [Inquilinus limosus]
MTPRAATLRRYQERPERFLRDHADDTRLRLALLGGSRRAIQVAIHRAVVWDDRAAEELRQLLGQAPHPPGRG